MPNTGHIHLILDFKYCQSANEQDNSEITAIEMYLAIYLSTTSAGKLVTSWYPIQGSSNTLRRFRPKKLEICTSIMSH